MKNADIKQLALLCELIDTQSLTEAASRMAITPSAANQSLARLKLALGDDIYVRQGHEYRLTPFGEKSVAQFRHLVNAWRQITEDRPTFDPTNCSDRISIACSEAQLVIEPIALYAEIATEAPGVIFDLLGAFNSQADIVNLRAAQIDLVCTRLAPPAQASDLHSLELGSWRATVCCFNANHPRIRTELTLDQYLREVHLIALYGTRRELQESQPAKELDRLGYQRRVSLVGSLNMAAELLSKTDHLLTCTEQWAQKLCGLANNVWYLPLPPEIRFPAADLYMVWHQRTHHSPLHRWLRDKVKSHARKEP